MNAKKINKRRAAAILDEARLQLAAGKAVRAAELLSQLVEASELSSPEVFALLADAHSLKDDHASAISTLEEGLRRFPKEIDLEARLGNALVLQGNVDEGLERLERAKARLGRQPEFLSQYAFALVRAGRGEEAEAAVNDAIAAGGGLQPRLILAMARGRQGRFAEAEEIAASVEKASIAKQPKLAFASIAVRADARLFRGDAAGALALWKSLRSQGVLDNEQLGHMAYAAELAGEPALCDELCTLRKERGPNAEDLLLFSQISNLRGQPAQALEQLEQSKNAPGERYPGFEFEVLATRGRALRLLGRGKEARAELEAAAGIPEADNARLGAKVEIDLGHLAAEEGDFETAERHFQRALVLDADDPEARRALELSGRRVAWKTELADSAQSQLEAARAEAEALRRRFLSREGELEALRRELQTVKASRRKAEKKAHLVEEEARRAREDAERAHARKVQEELATREKEIDQKAQSNVELALAPGPCPESIKAMLLVAERTFQKALYTELPAAAVTVLYCGALERALFVLFVERFDRWLSEKGLREEFLQAAVRERRGKRVEYFDHFVEAFDQERAGRAPALGEIGRVLERRHEPYLRAFLQFLAESYPVGDAFFDELAAFVLWSKQELRDPAAHGRGGELGYEPLKRFREQLLLQFGARKRGALGVLLSPAAKEK